MKIAYFSPLPPLKSGISDYSRELLPQLAQILEIDLFVDNYQPTCSQIKSDFKIFNIDEFHRNKMYKHYDQIIYHIGNNSAFHQNIYNTALKYPGVVVLHDYALHHMIAQLTIGIKDFDAYVEEMKYNYGQEGVLLARQSIEGGRRRIWNTGNTLQYPLNKRILEHSQAVIVHSNFLKNLIFDVKSNLAVRVAPLPTPDIAMVSEKEKKQLREKYRIPLDSIVISSFGLISKDKRIHKVLAALNQLKEEKENFSYILVGEEQEDFKVQEILREMDLQDRVTCTGFVDLNTFKDYIRMSDFSINLRYPTQGETSASLIRILGMGKPVIVTDVGTFSDYPETITLKVGFGPREVEDIYRSIKLLMEDPKKREEMSRAAFQYIKENHDISKTAGSYVQLLKDIQMGRLFKNNVHAYPKLLSEIGDALYSIGIKQPDRMVIKKIAEKIEEII